MYVYKIVVNRDQELFEQDCASLLNLGYDLVGGASASVSGNTETFVQAFTKAGTEERPSTNATSKFAGKPAGYYFVNVIGASHGTIIVHWDGTTISSHGTTELCDDADFDWIGANPIDPNNYN